MTYGFTLVNDNDIAVIDDNYSNYIVIGSGTNASGTAAPATNSTSTTYIYSTANVTRRFGDAAIITSNQSNYEWIQVAQASSLTNPQGDYGLRVYNASQGLVFDSNARYAHPVANLTYVVNSLQATATFNVGASPLGKKRYYCLDHLGRWYGRFATGNPNISYIAGIGATIASNSVTLFLTPIGNGPGTMTDEIRSATFTTLLIEA